MTELTAVLFDFGGVITTSPFENFAAYEQASGLPTDLIRTINSTNPDSNAWAQLERSAVSRDEFCALFEAEGAALGHEVSGAAVLDCLRTELRPFMVNALGKIHAKYATAMLTNNFVSHADQEAQRGVKKSEQISSGASFADIAHHFDHVIESAVVGVRKPDPEIYRMACEAMGKAAEEVVFLDDLGINLKPARDMGMTTIKVVDGHDGLAALSELLELDLT